MVAVILSLALSGGADLEQLAKRYQFTWSHDARTGRHTVRLEGVSMTFVPGLEQAIVNGVPTRLTVPVRLNRGRVVLPSDLAYMIEQYGRKPALPKIWPGPPKIAKPRARTPRIPPVLIVIDPGHGGDHTGGVGRTGLQEKRINLGVAMELKRLLESWGAEIVMTRMTDRHLSSDLNLDLDRRVAIANGARADLFISVHTNWVDDPGPRGYEVFVPQTATGRRDRHSRELAQLIRGELGRFWTSPDRGTKERNFRVLRNTRCPAVLVELEFVSNRNAERQLSRRSVQRELARRLAEAARSWALRHKR